MQIITSKLLKHILNIDTINKIYFYKYLIRIIKHNQKSLKIFKVTLHIMFNYKLTKYLCI